jgi:hypothetical protein
VRVDPVNQHASVSGVDNYRSVRSGDWHDPSFALRAALRAHFLDVDAGGAIYDYYDVGWRCVRPAP